MNEEQPNDAETSAGSLHQRGSLFHYEQRLREAALEQTEGQPVQQRADALNLMEAIIEGEMSPEEIVSAVMEDELPEVYRPRRSDD